MWLFRQVEIISFPNPFFSLYIEFLNLAKFLQKYILLVKMIVNCKSIRFMPIIQSLVLIQSQRSALEGNDRKKDDDRMIRLFTFIFKINF